MSFGFGGGGGFGQNNPTSNFGGFGASNTTANTGTLTRKSPFSFSFLSDQRVRGLHAISSDNNSD
jgi:hypothetical protein